MSQTHPMTARGKEKLEQELNQLITVEREEIKNALKEARALGDLKENAEYHAAKERQSHNEGKIAELQSKLANCKVVNISTINSDTIVFGATVTLFNEEKDMSVTYQIVGEDEADTNSGRISYNSPLGKALIGKEVGDEVVVKAPKGDVIYEVENFEFK